MKRIQIIGLALLVICGAISELFDFNKNAWAIWLLAIGAVIGMLLVLSEYFRPKQ